MWVTSSLPERGPHLVPLWFCWDGRALWFCTGADTPTARNLRAEPRVRLALPDSEDVVLIEGLAECFPDAAVPVEAAARFTEKFGWDPRASRADFVHVRVVPRTVRAWSCQKELPGRVVMRNGEWAAREDPGSGTAGQ